MEKLLKISLRTTGISYVFIVIFHIAQMIISYEMQSYYHSQIDAFPERTEEWLARKAEWVEFGTRDIFPGYITDFFFFSFFLLSFIALILKFISLKEEKKLIKKVLIISSASCVLSLIVMRIAVSFMDYVTFTFIFFACCVSVLLLLLIAFLKKNR